MSRQMRRPRSRFTSLKAITEVLRESKIGVKCPKYGRRARNWPCAPSVLSHRLERARGSPADTSNGSSGLQSRRSTQGDELGLVAPAGRNARKAAPDASAAANPAAAGQLDGDGLAGPLAGMVMSGAVSWCCWSPSASFGVADASPPAVDSRVGKGQEPR